MRLKRKNKIVHFPYVMVCVVCMILGLAGINRVAAQGIFSQDTYYLPQGGDILLAPTSKVSGNFQWVCEENGVVSVDSWGIVHARSQGRATVSAKNTQNSETSKCCVEVGGREPVKAAFASVGIIGTDESFEVKAITPKGSESLRVEVRCADYSKKIYCDSKVNRGDCDIWQESIKVPRSGECNIDLYAKINGSWQTCGTGHIKVFIQNGGSKSTCSLFRRAVSSQCADFIASCEGFSSKAYKDSSGILTIGYGKRIYPYEPFYNNIIQEEGKGFFLKDLNQGIYAKSVNEFLVNNSIKFNQQQFDALVSFSYNLGCGWMKNGSDLSKVLLRAGGENKIWYGIVNSDNGIWVRSRPSTSGKKLKALRDRTRVDILNPNKESDGWYHVRTPDGVEGYCFGEYLKLDFMNSGEKSLGSVNRNDFINEFSRYHHAGGKCLKGLVIRRFRELDIFFDGIYLDSRVGHGDYPIPSCARSIM